MTETVQIRIGSRASPLARWQSEWVAEQLRDHGHSVQIVWITTEGDVTTGPIRAGSGQGLFTKEIQRALLDQRIDLAVHSLKDLPTESIEGLSLAAVPPREKCGDVLVSRSSVEFDQLAAGARVGTGSLRRRAQLLHWRPDLVMVDLRGNVETRLRKLEEGVCDALVLAEAGLIRLGFESRITMVLPKDRVLPAVGQGALGLETREDDPRTIDAVVSLNHLPTRHCVVAERTLLSTLRGGCMAPVGAWARLEANAMTLDAVVLSRDGRHRLQATTKVANSMADAIQAGKQVAEDLLNQGAAELITQSRDAG